MKKSALVILVLLTLSATSFAERVTGNYADAKAQSAKLGKPLLIDFFTEW
jgi:hypothetical protein